MVVSEASRSPATVASEDPHRQSCGERRPKLLASAELVGTYHLGRKDRLGRLGAVHTTSGSATGRSRQPVQIRSSCRAALLPSLPAHTSAA